MQGCPDAGLARRTSAQLPAALVQAGRLPPGRRWDILGAVERTLTGGRSMMANAYALSVVLSAFLLFQIQPMIGKAILPWFGGTSAVWSTVLLFFQCVLTGGYAYAYWLLGRLRRPPQGIVHLVFLAISLGLLGITALTWPSPLTPDIAWRPLDSTLPDLGNPDAAGRLRRGAVPPAGVQQHTDAGLVRSRAERSDPLSPVCVVQCRFLGGADQLPARVRASPDAPSAGLPVDGGLRGLCRQCGGPGAEGYRRAPSVPEASRNAPKR